VDDMAILHCIVKSVAYSEYYLKKTFYRYRPDLPSNVEHSRTSTPNMKVCIRVAENWKE